MFGYEGGFSPETLAVLIAERTTARVRWPFLTTLDMSMVHNEQQLTTIVKDRTGANRATALADVRQWRLGYDERRFPSRPLW